jgi:putative ABC transport system substrate-binding protein
VNSGTRPRPGLRSRLASRLRAGALALALLTVAAPAMAGNVVILRSRTLGAYDQAIAGFEGAYRGTVTQFTVEDSGGARLAARVAALRPDALVAVGLRAATYARDHFPRTPIVFCVVQDPERSDLGGAWITGVSTAVSQGTELASFRTAVPDVRRIAVFYGRETGGDFARAARAAAAASGLELVEVALGNLSELAGRARDVVGRVDALWMPADPTVAASEPFRFLLKLSLERRKPLLVFSDALVKAGALAAVVPDYGAAGAQAAEAVRRIQSGERAGDIPVAAVRRTRLVVNEATARALGRELPVAVRRDGEVLP